jgi:hypothetical protein
MTDLTPESEYLAATIDEDTTLDELRSHLAAIEAAAIARHAEGLAGLYEYGAFQSHDCANDQASWRDRCPVASARRLLALDAPEAQVEVRSRHVCDHLCRPAENSHHTFWPKKKNVP